MAADLPDTLLLRAPGLEAEFAAKALTLEGIPCRLVCGGLSRLRLPGEEPEEPFAVTLPVEVYVPGAMLEEARSVLASFDRTDPVGESWRTGGPGRARDREAAPPRPALGAAAPLPAPAPPTTVRAEGTFGRLVFLAAVAALAGLWLLRC